MLGGGDLPGPAPVHFDDQRPTEKRPHHDQRAQDGHVGQGQLNRDRPDDVGRDQGLTFQSLQSLREVIEEYPDSEYARSAILKFDLAFDHLAAKEMEIGRYYLKRGHYTAAINRFRVVVEQYQTTTHAPEALMRLTESYLALGVPEEARKTAAVLGANYPGSKWYERAYRLIGENPPVAAAAKTATTS